MATLTIKNIPEMVYRRLKRQAAKRRRSLNQEIIACLEQSSGTAPVDPVTFLAQARDLRHAVKGRPLTERRLRQLKSVGRL
jgi:plasmid stability protein